MKSDEIQLMLEIQLVVGGAAMKRRSLCSLAVQSCKSFEPRLLRMVDDEDEWLCGADWDDLR